MDPSEGFSPTLVLSWNGIGFGYCFELVIILKYMLARGGVLV